MELFSHYVVIMIIPHVTVNNVVFVKYLHVMCANMHVRARVQCWREFDKCHFTHVDSYVMSILETCTRITYIYSNYIMYIEICVEMRLTAFVGAGKLVISIEKVIVMQQARLMVIRDSNDYSF